MLFKNRLWILNSVLLMALGGAAWGRRADGITLQKADFFQSLQLPFHGYTTREIELTPSERDLLEPDATLLRQYVSGDEFKAELAVIAGHKKRSVHTPGFCLAGGGWETASQGSAKLKLGSREVEAQQDLIVKDRFGMLVTYFFTDGEFTTRSLPRYQALQLAKRLRGGFPLGALVRIRVPVTKDPSAAMKTTDEFAQAVVPPVLDSLRDAGASAR